jgi:hypothetical protein
MASVFDGLDLDEKQQAELATLQRGFKAFNELVEDPQTALAVKRKLREKHPEWNIRIPEDDIAEPLLKPIREQVAGVDTKVTEALTKLDEKAAAIDAKLAERDQKDKDNHDLGKLQSSIEGTVKKHRFTDEGKAALIKHMMDTSTSDPETAAAYLLQNMERPSPVSSNGSAPAEAIRNGAPNVNLFELATGHDDESLKLLHTKPDQWMLKEVQKVIDEGAVA